MNTHSERIPRCLQRGLASESKSKSLCVEDPAQQAAGRFNLFEGTERILVIKLRHIGDVLLTVPAIRALKENFPRASVSALVNSGTEEMLTLNPLLSEVICFKREIKKLPLTSRISGELGFVSELRKKKFDMTVDLTGGDRPALLSFLTGARYRLGYEPRGGFAGKRLFYTHLARAPKERTHTVIRDLGVLREFGIDTRDLSVSIYTSPEDEAHVQKILDREGIKGPFVHAHPTSRWLFKCWTDEGMAFVFDKLQAGGLKVVVTSGPDERELKRTASIISKMNSKPLDLSGQLRLKHLSALSKRALFFFGVDSAPMHIAAASGARVVSIFGPSGAFDWGPWDNRAASSEKARAGTPYPLKNGVQASGSNIVIQKDWDCVPCGKDGCKGSKKSDCFDRLEPEFVWEIIKRAVT